METNMVRDTIELNSRKIQNLRASARFEIMALRDEVPFQDKFLVDAPDKVFEYFKQAIKGKSGFKQDIENFIVLFVNSRRRVIGHEIVSHGTLDMLLVHPREVFKAAIVMNAQAIIVMHNHPSGDSAPSEADIRVTRDLIRAGQLLKIEVLDHVIVGDNNKTSLKEMGYFYA